MRSMGVLGLESFIDSERIPFESAAAELDPSANNSAYEESSSPPVVFFFVGIRLFIRGLLLLLPYE